MRCSSHHRSLPPVWRSIIISLCSLPPRSPPCLSVCVSVRGVRGSTRLVLGDTVRPRSPPPWSLCSPFYSSFPSSSAQLDSDAAEQLDSDVRGSAFNHLTLLNGGEGGKNSAAGGLTHAEHLSIQPRPNLPAARRQRRSNTPTCSALTNLMNRHLRKS